jgi:hypothetical protein
MIATASQFRSVWPYRAAAALVILAAAAARIVYLACYCPLDLAPDEAHYWDWSRHLDWSYYSKGPLVALLIRASCELFGPLALSWTGSEMLAVRLPAVACGALLMAALYTLIVQAWRRDDWALAALVIGTTFPMLSAGASLMTIDAPLTCFWAWGLVAGFEAVVRGRMWAWPAAGACVALGILAKPTMVLFVPCVGLLLLCTPELRAFLWRREFWFFTGVAFLGSVPILVWNWRNDWVTLRHTGLHAGVNSGKSIHPTGPLVYLGTQAGLLFVYWFLVWAGAIWRYRPWTTTRLEVRYLWFMSAPIFAFFGLFSLKNGGGEPNWPIVCYLAGLPLSVGWLAELLTSPSPWIRRTNQAAIAGVAGLGVIATLLVHFPLHCQPVFAALAGPPTAERPMAIRRFDPTARLRGWRTLAASVEAERIKLREQGIEPELAGMNWILPGEIGFHLADHPTVYTMGLAQKDRHSQYDLWHPNPIDDDREFLGRTFIVVGASEQFLRHAFERYEPTRLVEHREGDYLVSMWTITVAHGYRGCRNLVDKDAARH